MCGIGSCIGSCCGSAAGACCSNCCASCFKCGQSKPNSRLPYLIIMFFGVVLALVLRYWGSPLLVHLFYFSYELCDSSRCLGFGAAYRVSFTLFLFFFIHGCAMFAKGAISFHVGMWGAKMIALIGFLFITLLIPNNVFDVYSFISRFVSGLFLLVQIIILIDFAYTWQENWTSDEKQWYIPTFICGLGLFAGSVTLWVFCFKWFAPTGSECVRNQFFVGWTIAMTVVFTVISLSNKTNGGILPAGVVALYTAYLCYSSLSSDPSSCNSLDSSDTTPVVIGIIIAAFSTSYAGWSLSNSKALFGDGDVDTSGDEMEKQAEEASAGDEEKGASKSKEDETQDDEVTRKRHLKFHFVMAACSMYIAMVLTNWGSETSSSISYNLGEETVWIKIVSQWVTSLLYIWSLVAPILLPDRFAAE